MPQSFAPRSLPLIPEAVLRHHHAFERTDTRFRAAARLLQSLWRTGQELAPGTYRTRPGTKRKLGSRLGGPDASQGRNFMTPQIAGLARHELAYRERGALIDERRLFTNLLSSQPLAFNLFGPLRLRPKLAVAVLRNLLPDIDIRKVIHIAFEHSPTRYEPAFVSDRSALDVAIYYERGDGSRGLLGIEVKYSEANEYAAEVSGDRYCDLAQASGLFKDPTAAELHQGVLQQLFREHLLTQTALIRGDVKEARFLLIAPYHNHLVQRTADLYADQLNAPLAGQAAFQFVALEQVIVAYGRAREANYAEALHDRYTRWDKVDVAVEQALLAHEASWELIPPQRAAPIALLAKAA